MNVDAVVVGLGNPGPRYAFTRHNIGFIALDVLAQNARAKFAVSKKWKAEELSVEWKSKKLLLLKPLTFMNLSGESLQALYAQHNHLREKPLIVVQDEVDIPFGQLRVKFGGGDAGHNGLKSVRGVLGHGDYYRIRMGVGRPVQGSPVELADYVLASFKKEEHETLKFLIDGALDAIPLLVDGQLDKAQQLAAKV